MKFFFLFSFSAQNFPGVHNINPCGPVSLKKKKNVYKRPEILLGLNPRWSNFHKNYSTVKGSSYCLLLKSCKRTGQICLQCQLQFSSLFTVPSQSTPIDLKLHIFFFFIKSTFSNAYYSTKMRFLLVFTLRQCSSGPGYQGQVAVFRSISVTESSCVHGLCSEFWARISYMSFFLSFWMPTSMLFS